MPTNDVKLERVLIKGGNSGVAVEMDLGIIHTVMQWFVSEAPKELRTLNNVGRVIRFNDQLIELLEKETKSSLQYIEKKMIEETGIPDSQYPVGIDPEVARMHGGINKYFAENIAISDDIVLGHDNYRV